MVDVGHTRAVRGLLTIPLVLEGTLTVWVSPWEPDCNPQTPRRGFQAPESDAGVKSLAFEGSHPPRFLSRTWTGEQLVLSKHLQGRFGHLNRMPLRNCSNMVFWLF